MRKTLYNNQPQEEVANSLKNLGMIYDKKGDQKKGLCHLMEALNMQQTIHNRKPHKDIALAFK